MKVIFYNALGIFILCCTFVILCVTNPAIAETESKPASDKQPAFSLSTTPVYQFKAPLHHGSVSVFQEHTNLRWSGEISSKLSVGLNLTYDFADYHFSGPTTLAGGFKPWGKTHTLNLSNTFRYELNPEWKLLVAPSVFISREDNAGWSNAVGYGGHISLIRDISPNLSLGIGAGAFNNLNKMTFFPGLMVKWRITDRLLLANPFRPGPTGPAGLELSYLIKNKWDIGMGMAYRHNRFRLNSNSYTRDGIGETSSMPAWVRFSRNLGNDFNLDLYSGVVFGGMMQIDNSSGSRLSSDHFAPAPFLALTASVKF